MNKTILVILGPTATGKTALSLKIAGELNGEIISADSTQVFKGLDIITAKLPKEQRTIPHHLMDILEPDQDFTINDFQKLAFEAIQDIWSRGKLPILVGGSGLYLKAVTEGLNLPYAPPNPEFREQCRKEEELNGEGFLHRKLTQVDPSSARRLHVNDSRRIIRALEVLDFTQKPLSAFYQIPKIHPLGLKSIKIGLGMDREKLYRRLEDRTLEQVEEGLIQEVRNLLAKGYREALLKKNFLGYPEMISCIEGEIILTQALEIFQQRNRNLAKKQLTWFRADKEILWFKLEDYASSRELADCVLKEVKNRLKEGI